MSTGRHITIELKQSQQPPLHPDVLYWYPSPPARPLLPLYPYLPLTYPILKPYPIPLAGDEKDQFPFLPPPNDRAIHTYPSLFKLQFTGATEQTTRENQRSVVENLERV